MRKGWKASLPTYFCAANCFSHINWQHLCAILGLHEGTERLHEPQLDLHLVRASSSRLWVTFTPRLWLILAKVAWDVTWLDSVGC